MNGRKTFALSAGCSSHGTVSILIDPRAIARLVSSIPELAIEVLSPLRQEFQGCFRSPNVPRDTCAVIRAFSDEPIFKGLTPEPLSP